MSQPNLFYGKITDQLILYQNRELKEFYEKFKNKEVVVRIDRLTKQRTPEQNSALHLGFAQLAGYLNDSGLDMRVVLKPTVSIDWTKDSVKDYLFRPIMEKAVGKKSTTELDKLNEIEKVWDTMFRFLGEKHGVEYIPFPSKESQASSTT